MDTVFTKIGEMVVEGDRLMWARINPDKAGNEKAIVVHTTSGPTYAVPCNRDGKTEST